MFLVETVIRGTKPYCDHSSAYKYTEYMFLRETVIRGTI